MTCTRNPVLIRAHLLQNPAGVAGNCRNNAAAPHPLHFGGFPKEEDLPAGGEDHAVRDALLASRDSEAAGVFVVEPPGEPFVLERQPNLAAELIGRTHTDRETGKRAWFRCVVGAEQVPSNHVSLEFISHVTMLLPTVR